MEGLGFHILFLGLELRAFIQPTTLNQITERECVK